MTTAYEDILNAFNDMKKEGCKINKNAVATRANRNIANLSKPKEEWVKLKEDIEEAESEWLRKRTDENKDAIIKSLKSKLQLTKKQLAKEKQNNNVDPVAYEKEINSLLVELQEMYREIDRLKAKVADLNNQLLHSTQDHEIRVDVETGEIIKGIF
ncbi:hypothetical protein [Pseudoalteromonas lipolytica]|uniref:hypothetical protein n=1 Tax=Pseudoalteromonas lipolytica TaxID=570156 RepID=UPI000825D9F1|nr:hypothetical protein [Pseudoalteromonas lipolytica]